MNKINALWHGANKMPKNPSTKERLAWHVAHEKHCNCRKMPESLRELLKK